MRRLLLASLAAAALHVSTASAEGLYISGSAGAAFLESSRNTAGPSFDIAGDYATGWALRGALGYGFA